MRVLYKKKSLPVPLAPVLVQPPAIEVEDFESVNHDARYKTIEKQQPTVDGRATQMVGGSAGREAGSELTWTYSQRSPEQL